MRGSQVTRRRRGGRWFRWRPADAADGRGPASTSANGPAPPLPGTSAADRYHYRYEELSRAEAEAAFEAFVAERPAALERLTAFLRSLGADPSWLLEPEPERLTPLWQAVSAHLTDRRQADGHTTAPVVVSSAAGAASAARTGPPTDDTGALPSWVRHTVGDERILTDPSLHLVDGLISQVALVVQRAVPSASWRMGYDRVASYHLQQHPVLGSDREERGVTQPVAAAARRHLLHRSGAPHVDGVPDDVLTARVRVWIEWLGAAAGTPPATGEDDEPLVEVSATDADPAWFELYVREDLAHERSELVDRLAGALTRLPGVDEAFREDRERLLVRAPTWAAQDLRMRALAFLDDGRSDSETGR